MSVKKLLSVAAVIILLLSLTPIKVSEVSVGDDVNLRSPAVIVTNYPTIETQIEKPIPTEIKPIPQPKPTVTLILPHYRENIPLSKELQLHINNLCREKEVAPDIVYALIYCESSFKINNHNKKSDCRGLMQISNYWYGKGKDLFDPFLNTEMGITMLRTHLDEFNNDYHKALMCYNMGRSRAKSYFNKGIYSTKYSRKVINLANSTYCTTT